MMRLGKKKKKQLNNTVEFPVIPNHQANFLEVSSKFQVIASSMVCKVIPC